MAYRNHDAFVDPARPKSDLGSLILGIIFIELAFIFGFIIMYGVMTVLSQDPDAIYQGTTAGGMLIQLFTFAFFGIAVILVAELRHNRDFLSLIGNPFHVVRDFRATFIALCMIMVLLEVIYLTFYGSQILEVRNVFRWAALLPISVLALLIQTGSEELFYRGYVQQQLAARFNSPLIWLIVPNILFAWAHYSSEADYTSNMQTMIWTFSFGLVASDLTARSGNLGPAFALHLANNIAAMLLYGEHGGQGSGLALILFPSVDADIAQGQSAETILSIGLIYQLGFLLIIWLTARNALRR
ncbi:CPBP family intramembrane glutamic endopeptidase [Parasulfitobacter algicola]|uniref:CPBP family intramembrane metalloprotease n=1 Tax=Parasulfitobacter algicola TaxID=2614809 RepID=A0ABX2INW8_9RHOB|nr:type II CAAX endopeptidase family protein [Sulfitobacter algicola]NSX54582.1 CPBP family intramembrane metalloprotease [Sulfitobacter algicola]